MKKLCCLLTLVMLIGAVSVNASAESGYSQSPLLDEAVNSGLLPPVEERLPEEPKLAHEILDEYLDYECGNYGGTLRLLSNQPNSNPDAYIAMNEALLSMSSINSEEILPNVVANYEVSDDMTVYTFTLRKGLKWSDGVEVTMEDFRFCIEDYIFNETLTPVVAAYMRDGGSTSGSPFEFDIVDELTFKISFNSAYGGFPVHLSAASWKGYTEFLKPAHYLKPFHIDYADECHGSLDAYYDFIQPFAEIIGYEDARADNTWTYVFHQIDMLNNECNNPSAALTTITFSGLIESDFPHLYPWIMSSSTNGVITWVRNPYYFKVDSDGQQLPYIDYVTSSFTQSDDVLQLEFVAGKADFVREHASIDNISLYRENEVAGGFTTYVADYHMNPLAYYINLTYGLNTDGSVADDEYARIWQEVVQDARFRKAVAICIDAQEIMDSVYHGMGEVNPRQGCIGDFDTAKAMLDDMGMIDIDGDGYRETPSGKQFYIEMWHTNLSSDMALNTELFVEYCHEIGIKVNLNLTEFILLFTSWYANEVPCSIWWNGAGVWYEEWAVFMWGPLYNNWYLNGGLYGGAQGELTPPDDVQEVLRLWDSMFRSSPEIAANETFYEIADRFAALNCGIVPITGLQQCMLINSDIGNVPTGGVGIGWNYAVEQMFYRSFEYK